MCVCGRARESVFNVSESVGHLETLNVMLGVVRLQMKVHHHLRVAGSRQSIKVKNVMGLSYVTITYGISHDQSIAHTLLRP